MVFRVLLPGGTQRHYERAKYKEEKGMHRIYQAIYGKGTERGVKKKRDVPSIGKPTDRGERGSEKTEGIVAGLAR